MANKKLPRIENILAFLKAKGFKMNRKTDLFHVLSPPAYLQIQEEFYYHIPRKETLRDYEKFISNVTNSISELYEIDYDELFELFSQNKEDLKKNIALKKEILAHVS